MIMLVALLIIILDLAIELEGVAVGIIGIDVVVIKHAILVGNSTIATRCNGHYSHHQDCDEQTNQCYFSISFHVVVR